MNSNKIRKDFFYCTLKYIENNCDVFTIVKNEKLISYCIVNNLNKNNQEIVDFYSDNNDLDWINEFSNIIFKKNYK